MDTYNGRTITPCYPAALLTQASCGEKARERPLYYVLSLVSVDSFLQAREATVVISGPAG